MDTLEGTGNTVQTHRSTLKSLPYLSRSPYGSPRRNLGAETAKKRTITKRSIQWQPSRTTPARAARHHSRVASKRSWHAARRTHPGSSLGPDCSTSSRTTAYAAPGPANAAQTGTLHYRTPAPARTTTKLFPQPDGATGTRRVPVRFKGQGACAQTQPDAVRSRAQAPGQRATGCEAIRASVQQQVPPRRRNPAQVLDTTTTRARRGASTVTSSRFVAGEPSDVGTHQHHEDMAPQNSGTPLIRTRSPYGRRARRTYLHRLHRQGREDCRARYRVSTTRTPIWVAPTQEAFEKSDTIPEGTYDPKRSLTATTWSRDDFNSRKKETSTPHPDNNPLDCGGYGSHVAGTPGRLRLKRRTKKRRNWFVP